MTDDVSEQIAAATDRCRAIAEEQRIAAGADDKRRAQERVASEQRAAARAHEQGPVERLARAWFGPAKQPPAPTRSELAVSRYNQAVADLANPALDRAQTQAQLQAAIDECVQVGVMAPCTDLPTELEQLAARAGAGVAVALPSETLVRLARELRSLRIPITTRTQ